MTTAEVRDENIQPPPRFATSARENLARVMGNVNGKLVVLLEADKVLPTRDILALAATAESPAAA